MNNKLLATIITAALAVVGLSSVVGAEGMHVSSNNNIVVASDETIDGAYYAAGNSVTIKGTINGDLYCAGQNISIEGKVTGDVICAGQSIRIGGEVLGDVRVAGQTIDFAGTVSHGATAFGQTVTLQKDAKVLGDINGAASNVTLAGQSGRDVLIGAASMTVTGSVARNIEGQYDQLSVSQGSSVGGSVNYSSNNKASISDGVVAGKVNYTHIENEYRRNESHWNGLGFAIYLLVAWLLVALAIALVAPRLVQAVTDNGIARLGMSVLTGFFVIFATPFIAGLLAVTVVGIPLAVLVMLLWVLLLMLSGPFFGYYLGRIIMRKSTTHVLLIMFIGSLVLLLGYLVPILNVLTIFAALVVGSGMIILELRKHYKKPSYTLNS